MASPVSLNLSPWPEVWSLGEGRGTPSEYYTLKAQEEAGFRTIRLFAPPPMRLPFPIQFLFWNLRFLQTVRRTGVVPALIVSHSPTPSLAAWWLARNWRVPAVLRMYGLYWAGRCPAQ